MDIPTQRAFSLVELLVTLSVLTLVLALALPSFQGLAEGNRRATATQQLLGLLNQARALAISRQALVSLCSAPSPAAAQRLFAPAPPPRGPPNPVPARHR